MVKSLAELDLHPLALGAMSYFFEGEGLSPSAPAERIFVELQRAFDRLPSPQVYPAGQDILKVAMALRHVGRFRQAEDLATALEAAIERRALHEGRIGMVSERNELAGRAYAELADLPTLRLEPNRRHAPSSAPAMLAKRGLEDMDLDALRRLAARADLALRPKTSARR